MSGLIRAPVHSGDPPISETQSSRSGSRPDHPAGVAGRLRTARVQDAGAHLMYGLMDTRRMMSEESTTPDLVELARRSIEAAEDIEAAVSFYAPDAVWDASPWGMGVFEGQAAVRGFFEDWRSSYSDIEREAEEIRDLGNGVTFAVILQKARRREQRFGSASLRGCRRMDRRFDRAQHDLHRHRRGPCCRRTPRRGTGVGDVGEPGPRALDLRGLGTRRLTARPSGPIPRSSS